MSTIAAHPVETDTKSTSRRRGVLGVVAIALLALALAGCMPADAQTFLDRTNSLRRTAGRPRPRRAPGPHREGRGVGEAHGLHRSPGALDAERGPQQPGLDGARRERRLLQPDEQHPAHHPQHVRELGGPPAGTWSTRSTRTWAWAWPRTAPGASGSPRCSPASSASPRLGRPRRHARLRPWPVVDPTCSSSSRTRSASARGCRRRCGCRGVSASWPRASSWPTTGRTRRRARRRAPR